MATTNNNQKYVDNLIADLQAEVAAFRATLDRQHRETQAGLERLQATFHQHYREIDQYISRIVRALKVSG